MNAPAHPQDAVESLQRFSPFNQMEPAACQALLEGAEFVTFAPGDVILSPERGVVDRLLVIDRGRVKAETPDGQAPGDGAWECGPGDCFPIGALLSNRAVFLVRRAVEETRCLSIPRANFDRVRGQSQPFQEFCSLRVATLLERALRGVQGHPGGANAGDDRSLNTPLHEMLRREPISCPPDTPIRAVLQSMERFHIGSMIVVDEQRRPAGVFTLHDVLSRVAIPQADLDAPIATLMTGHPVTLPTDAFAHEATLIMADKGFGHICVVDEAGALAGVVSERDLFALQRVGLANLSRAIPRAPDVGALAHLARDVHRLVDQMLAQGVSVDQVTDIITLLNDHIARRAIDLCLEADDPGVEFSWIAFGSEGRREQTLSTDQDNGILFQAPEGMTEDEARARLLPFARRVNEALAQCGFPLCKGEVMASNPRWCLSLAEWRSAFAEWIQKGDGQMLRNATIFFDFRTLRGPAQPVEDLRLWLLAHAKENRMFLRRLVQTALDNRPPLGVVRDFLVERDGDRPDTIDLKTHGIALLTDAARIFALAAAIADTNTPARLRKAGLAWRLNTAEVEAWVEAFHFIQLLRFRQQHQDERAGRTLSNRIAPYALNDLERRILKESFRQVRKLQGLLEQYFQF